VTYAILAAARWSTWLAARSASLLPVPLGTVILEELAFYGGL
jgi:hypothetical protein